MIKMSLSIEWFKSFGFFSLDLGNGAYLLLFLAYLSNKNLYILFSGLPLIDNRGKH